MPTTGGTAEPPQQPGGRHRDRNGHRAVRRAVGARPQRQQQILPQHLHEVSASAVAPWRVPGRIAIHCGKLGVLMAAGLDMGIF